VGKGFIFPCVLAPEKNGKDYRFQFRLLPRYAGFEQEIRNVLRLGGVRTAFHPSSRLRGIGCMGRGPESPDISTWVLSGNKFDPFF
jgi:hypothetical protein